MTSPPSTATTRETIVENCRSDVGPVCCDGACPHRSPGISRQPERRRDCSRDQDRKPGPPDPSGSSMCSRSPTADRASSMRSGGLQMSTRPPRSSRTRWAERSSAASASSFEVGGRSCLSQPKPLSCGSRLRTGAGCRRGGRWPPSSCRACSSRTGGHAPPRIPPAWGAAHLRRRAPRRS